MALAFMAVPAVYAREFEVGFELEGKRRAILLQARINGKDRTLVLDTGAVHTVVSPAVVGGDAAFKLQASRFRPSGPGISGEAIWSQVESFKLGELTLYDQPVAVMNLKEASRVFGRTIDGLLGQDILGEFDSVVIDFKKRRIRLIR